MKIKSLWISEYKNVRNINLNFDTDLTTLLVGKNGLGKSNLIEALAIIFSELDSFENEASLKIFSAKFFNFEVEYICCSQLIHISLINGELIIKYCNDISAPRHFVEMSFSEFKKNKHVAILPKYIIGYYSGENKRLRSIIKDHEQNQIRVLKNWHKSGKNDESDSLRRVFFAENHHGQTLLLTLALYKNHDIFGGHITKLFEQYLGIERLMDFDIKFKNPKWNFINIKGINKSVEYLIANINDNIENPFWNLKGKIDILLTRLYNYQFDYGNEPIIYEENKEEFIEFSQINIDKFSKELYNYFPHPIDFFNALESTNIVEIFHEIRIHVKKTNLEFPIFYSELSEGEQQLISVLGLILVAGVDDTLFLLDEPDTHLNPNWQRDYIRLLQDFNLNDDNSHIFVATHSPLIVQAVEGKYDILLYHQNNEGNIEIDNDPEIIKNWRIDQVLSSKYFGIENTRPKGADDFMKKREELLSKETLNSEDYVFLKFIEDNDLLPSGETLNDFKAMHLIHIAARRLEEKDINDKNL